MGLTTIRGGRMSRYAAPTSCRVCPLGKGVASSRLNTGDQVDMMEPLESPSPEPTGAPPLARRRSVFRDVHWRWSDVLIGFAPLVALALYPSVVRLAWLPVMPSWTWLPLGVLGQL